MEAHLSPTNIATYYHNQCQLYIHNVFHKEAEGHSKKESSPLALAQFSRGLEWEAKLFRFLESRGQLERCPDPDRPKSPIEIKDLMTNVALNRQSPCYISNLSFYSPDFQAELANHGHLPHDVTFGVAKPDLVKVIYDANANEIVWEIIDAKASSALKSSHNAQIGFYHICIETILKSLPSQIKFIPSEKASVWLPNPEDPESFPEPVSTPISLLLPPLRIFLFKTLPDLLKLPREKVEWYLNPACQGCDFIDSCTMATKRHRRLGLIPNLSHSEARFIREVLSISSGSPQPNSSEIEDMDRLFKSRGYEDLNRKYPATTKRFSRLLGLQTHRTHRWSPRIEAALSGEPKLTNQRVLTFPKSEDIAIFISFVVDVSKSSLGYFCISSSGKSDGSRVNLMTHAAGKAENFVATAATYLRNVLTHFGNARTQVYTYSPAERTAIVNHLINAALAHPADEEVLSNVRLCLGALCEGTTLLLTSYQPLILSGVLLSFLSKKNLLKKDNLKICCQRLGLDDQGSVEAMRTRLDAEQKRLALLGGRAGNDPSKREFGQLGKIVVLKREIERLISLPIPGYIDLPSTANSLIWGSKYDCKTDDDLYALLAVGKTEQLDIALKDRNRTMKMVVRNVRDRIEHAKLTNQVLLNDAKPLEVGLMDLCQTERLRKLLFMIQFEVVVRLQSFWQDRLDGCPNAPLLKYVGPEKKESKWYHRFDIISGALEPKSDDRTYYDWLLVASPEESSPSTDVPPEIYFDDLPVSGLIFPLSRWTKSAWENQHPTVRSEITVANITEVGVTSGTPKSHAILQTYFTGKTLQRGKLYRLSPRLVDFNLTRTLLNLVIMDFEQTLSAEEVPFVQLIDNLYAFSSSPSFCGREEEIAEKKIHKRFSELSKLGVKQAEYLLLKSSQHRAAKRMLSKRLSVIWGPPGTGKTHTLALSTLRLLESLGRRAAEVCPVVLVTAMTHAAIDAIQNKMITLMEYYRSIPDLNTDWLNNVKLERVYTGADHPLPEPSVKATRIYAGTTFQLYKFCDRGVTANLIIIDEAGQLSLGIAALVIRWLSPTGKLVLAGDHEQLAPILGTEYPVSEGPPLFGSVLDMLMNRRTGGLKIAGSLPNSQDVEMSQQSDNEGEVIQLLENFRLNADLGEFVELIYAKKFKSMKPQTSEIAESLQLWLDTDSSEDPVMEQARLFLLDFANAMLRKEVRKTKLLAPRISSPIAIGSGPPRAASLALIRVRATQSMLPYEAHVKAEAKLAAALVHWLREAAGVEHDIFVATPHRIQRSAVRQAILSPQTDFSYGERDNDENMSEVDKLAEELNAFHVSETGLRIDTVERLQGSEASFVIFLLSHTHLPSIQNHLEFYLERRRLNVGISRAKSLCIVVSSRGVLQPGIESLSRRETKEGLEFLRAYEDRAWSGEIVLNVK